MDGSHYMYGLEDTIIIVKIDAVCFIGIWPNGLKLEFEKINEIVFHIILVVK